jgi:TonB-linked SusC/RagA family outer membrane protein
MYKKYTHGKGIAKTLYHKIWLIMRLTTIILLITLLQVSAATRAQNLTLKKTNASLKSIFSEVKKQTGYIVLYPSALVNNTKPVTVNFSNTPLKDAMNRILENQNLEFEIQDNSIVVRAKAPSFSDKVTAVFANIDVRGKVVDEKGQPLPGVTVKTKDLSQVTTTDKDGNFLLKKVNAKAVIIISFIGFLTKELNAADDLGTIQLEISNSKLDEVVIQAYGTTSRKFATSNIGTITADDIAKQPVSNPLLALQGRVPGLFIQQTSGNNLSEVSVSIQGKNSIQNGNDPFYVIDGVPYTPRFVGTLASGAIFGEVSLLNFISPGDIESVSILKDADATAIYGSRAANGAILITTKKGKAGKTKVDVNLQNGWGRITRKVDLLNTAQYLELRKEAYINAGQAVPNSATPPTSSNYDLTVWDQTRNTNWQDVLVGGTAQFTDLQASVSGGSPNTQFLAGYGFNRQTSVYPNHLPDIKGSVHFNLNHNSNDNKFKYFISGTYLQAKIKLNSTDLMLRASDLAPNAPALYNADGTLNFEPYPTNPNRYSFKNPLVPTLEQYIGNTNNLIANNTLSYEFSPGLVLKASAGYNRLQGDEIRIFPISSLKPDADKKTGSAEYLTKSISSWIMEPQLNYYKDTKFGVFDFLLGGTFQETNTNLFTQSASGFTSDDQLESIAAAPSYGTPGVVKNVYKYNALFGRFNYRLNDKYIVNLTARRDGSSRFGDENKFNNFYSVGGAWLFGDEVFFKKLPWLSSGKLRVNFGTTGNDQIGEYQYLSLLDPYNTGIPYQGATGLYPTNISNSKIQWEETRKINIGLDLGFFKNRLSLSANYFRNRSSNQLIGYILPSVTGFTSILRNFPATVQNTGLEIQLDVTPIKTHDFTWQTSVNMTIPRNRLINFPDLLASTYSSAYIIGQPINVQRLFKYGGVNPTTGLYEFITSTGTKTSSPNGATDNIALVDPNPKYYGAIINSFTYKRLQFDFMFQIVKQKAPNNKFGNIPGIGILNQPTSVLNRWTKPGDIASIQKSSVDFDILDPSYAVQGSDAAYGDASFARLKNASLSYAFSDKWLKGAGISSARIYIQAQNLLTITNYIGSDPETHSLNNIPPLKMMTVGIQASL